MMESVCGTVISNYFMMGETVIFHFNLSHLAIRYLSPFFSFSVANYRIHVEISNVFKSKIC